MCSPRSVRRLADLPAIGCRRQASPPEIVSFARTAQRVATDRERLG
ncbi:hypothetical protein [Micromonospora sp. IBHARD004]